MNSESKTGTENFLPHELKLELDGRDKNEEARESVRVELCTAVHAGVNQLCTRANSPGVEARAALVHSFALVELVRSEICSTIFLES